MANNPYVNKVDKADGTTIMDITDTTAVEGDVETGKVFYKASGARSIGTGTGGTGKLDQIAAYEEYSASSTYDLDDVVVINSRIWQCTTPISTPEEWTESHWTETSIDEQKADRADVEEISNVCVEFDVTIASTDWSSSSPYTYTWYNNAVGANSKVVVLLNDGAEAAGIDDFTYDKVTGGVQFTTDELPVGNLPLHIQIVEVVEMESYDIDIPVTIAVSDWSDTSPYTYTYTDARITDGCSVEVYFASGAENCDVRLLDYAKGTNSVTITADVLPAQSLPVIIHIENMESTGVAPLTASEVSTDAVTGETTVQGALGALVNDKADKVSGGTTGNVAKLDSNGGIADSGYTIATSVPSNAVFTDTTYSDATTSSAGLMSATDKEKLNGIASGATKVEIVNNLTTNDSTKALSAAQGKTLNDNKIETSAIKNNLTTSSSGYVLDARQGKALNDTLNSNTTTTITISIGNTGTSVNWIRKRGNMVTLALLINVSDTIYNSFVDIGTIPSGYRPLDEVRFMTTDKSASYGIDIRIKTDGALQASCNASLSSSQLRFTISYPI